LMWTAGLRSFSESEVAKSGTKSGANWPLALYIE
jgi:hypothetical protein